MRTTSPAFFVFRMQRQAVGAAGRLAGPTGKGKEKAASLIRLKCDDFTINRSTGLRCGRQIRHNDENQTHLLKVGVTLNLFQGLFAAQSLGY